MGATGLMTIAMIWLHRILPTVSVIREIIVHLAEKAGVQKGTRARGPCGLDPDQSFRVRSDGGCDLFPGGSKNWQGFSKGPDFWALLGFVSTFFQRWEILGPLEQSLLNSLMVAVHLIWGLIVGLYCRRAVRSGLTG